METDPLAYVEPSSEIVAPSGEVQIFPGAKSFAATVWLVGEHDRSTMQEVCGALDRLRGNVLVNLGQCRFLDSTIIRVLLEAAKKLQREGFTLEFVVPPEAAEVSRIVEVVGLRDLLAVHPVSPI
jgi:anti-anti-sigma factor